MAHHPRSATRKTFQKIADAVAALGGTVPLEAPAPTIRALLADPRLAGHERGQADDLGSCYDGIERKYGWESIAGTIYGPFRAIRLKASPQTVVAILVDACNPTAGEMIWMRQDDLDAHIAAQVVSTKPPDVVIDARALTLPEVEALYSAMYSLEVRDQWSNSWRVRLTLDQAMEVSRLFIGRRQQTQPPWAFQSLVYSDRRDLWDAKVSVLLKECLRPQVLPEAQRIVGLFEKLRL